MEPDNEGSASPSDEHLSVVWRCTSCARLHLSEDRKTAPQRCEGCGGADLRDRGPDSSF
jgi:hypothetical protein